MMRKVSSCVLKDVIRIKGTSTLWVVLRCSIWRTVRSKKVMSSLTSRADLAPVMPYDDHDQQLVVHDVI